MGGAQAELCCPFLAYIADLGMTSLQLPPPVTDSRRADMSFGPCIKRVPFDLLAEVAR